MYEVACQELYNTALEEGLEHFEEAEAANGHYSETYGLLYTYDAALAAIPEGWRLPSDADWKNLEKALGMTAEEVEKQDVWRGERQAVLLKEGEEGIGFDVRYGGARGLSTHNGIIISIWGRMPTSGVRIWSKQIRSAWE